MTTGMAFPSIIPAGQAKNGVTVAVTPFFACSRESCFPDADSVWGVPREGLFP